MSLREEYKKTIKKELKEKLGLSNIHEVPELKAVIVNVGMGRFTREKKDYSDIESNIISITGQKPNVRTARMSISNFKLRKGMPVGLKVTLRGQRMYDFVSKLVNVVLPRIRDFRGISKRSFDKDANYHMGIKEVGVFPDIRPDELKLNHGIQISFITNSKNKEANLELFKSFSFPFNK